ncbi:Uu.00g139660.m01.CDS01 [Anthostomella pinea]|uniref:Uu.00g139660.m01.CDS01 n=1 Tax=Anthostomella pinea TaxID=933095 RepID=A0AAI8VQ03_9PEZI|nr:Uu.00g139660.m01.CDS01 [Anthostomella pinea]
MRATTLLPTLLCVAGATPVFPRQDVDLTIIIAAPDPSTATIPIGVGSQVVSYDLPAATRDATVSPLPVGTEAATSLVAITSLVSTGSLAATSSLHLAARQSQACEPLAAGDGPQPTPDTADAFLAFQDFSNAAKGAVTPAGYVLQYQDLKASSNAYGYLGHRTLKTYAPDQCASQCNYITGCSGFGIYFERAPTVVPGSGDNCTDPASTTVIKCVFWGGYLAENNAMNDGQFLQDFHVVIAGSNGYMATAVPEVPGFTGQFLGTSTIDAPLDCNGQDTYMGPKFFSQSYYDPNLCAAACQSQNDYNTAHPPPDGDPQICRFFTTYLVARNGIPEGQYCALYTEFWDSSYATNEGQYRGNDHYTVGQAYSYSNTASPSVSNCTTVIA